MKKRGCVSVILVAIFLVGLWLGASPLLAQEELMTKLYFQEWLKASTASLEQRLADLQTRLSVIEQTTRQLRSQLGSEIKIRVGQYRASVDGVSMTMDVAPLIQNDRIMVPVRFIGECFGAEFSWDEKTRKVTYILEGTSLELAIDKKTAWVNGQAFTLDSQPIIRANRTLVPLRFIGEHMGATFSWHDATQEVTIFR